MKTGTWNQSLSYDVYYKTNMSDEYILFRDNLSADEEYELDFTEVKLVEFECITEVCYDFGRVDVGFKESSSPSMKCKAVDTLEDGTVFMNCTRTIGRYCNITVEAESEWSTVVHVPVVKHEKILPRTGR